jgi:cell division protein FtsI/penicillin-binding protein 2
MLPVREILIKSSNIGMAKIGQKLGSEKLYKGMRLFGFGRPTGIDLPGEVEGLLWPLNTWTGYSVTRIPFGQEITVTAIQLTRAFCMLSNGGHSVQPYIVQAMVDASGWRTAYVVLGVFSAVVLNISDSRKMMMT